jgi:hypothetical protein
VEQAFLVVETNMEVAELVVNSPIEPAGIRANTPLEDRDSVPGIVLSGKRIHHASEGAAK